MRSLGIKISDLRVRSMEGISPLRSMGICVHVDTWCMLIHLWGTWWDLKREKRPRLSLSNKHILPPHSSVERSGLEVLDQERLEQECVAMEISQPRILDFIHVLISQSPEGRTSPCHYPMIPKRISNQREALLSPAARQSMLSSFRDPNRRITLLFG